MQDLAPIENMEHLCADFLGLISDELKGALTSIEGTATPLIQAINDLEQAEMLQFFRIIDEKAVRMSDLVGELLQVARIETGTLSLLM